MILIDLLLEFAGDSRHASAEETSVRMTTDDALIDALSEISRTFASYGAQIWSPAFQPGHLPIVFLSTDGDGGPIVWSHNIACLTGVEATFEVAQGSQLLRRRGVAVVRPEGGCFVGSEIEGETCVVVDLDGDVPPVADPEFRRFVVHELFHFFQMFVENWKTPVGYDPFEPADLVGSDLALSELELELVERAVDADDEQLVALATRFCSIRAHRHAGLNRPRLSCQERGLEQIEGTARYVENRFAEAIGQPGRLDLPPEALNGDADWFCAGRFYRTGARIGEILDRLGVDWRQKLQSGQSPATILSVALGERNVAAMGQPTVLSHVPEAAR